jgi:hypothetical protein
MEIDIMPWNQDKKDKDPWERDRRQSPPDLDAVINKLLMARQVDQKKVNQ